MSLMSEWSAMDCQQAETALSLWVGNDLDDAGHAQLLQAHVDACPNCRRRSQEFVAAHTALQEARQHCPESPSLWPRVRAKLVEWESRPRFAKFNVLVPTVVATAACSVLVAVALVEIQRKMERWSSAPSLIARPWGSSPNLFETDPNHRFSRGAPLSGRDFARWQDAEFVPIQPAHHPSHHPSWRLPLIIADDSLEPDELHGFIEPMDDPRQPNQDD
jgi:hypothetical protein